MTEKYKTYVHTPPHLYRPGAKYFITASTFARARILDDKVKEKLLQSLMEACRNYTWELEDWVILDNHYHIMVTSSEDRTNLSAFVNEYHKFTALFIKKNAITTTSLPKIFNNYWDTCITFEKSYYARLNYLYHNPVKHGYVKNAEDYIWGSYYHRYRRTKEYVEKLNIDYPFDRVEVEDDY